MNLNDGGQGFLDLNQSLIFQRKYDNIDTIKYTVLVYI